MQERDALAECLVKQAGGLRREADLRDKQDGRKAAVKRPLHGGQIDRGLSRACDAMQKKWLESAESRRDCGQRLHLRLVQLEWLSGRSYPAHPEGLRALFNANKAAPHQRLQRRARQVFCTQLGQR